MRTVYRVEGPDGLGPYRGVRWCGWSDLCAAHHNSPKHPTPWHLWGDSYACGMLCGFSSARKARQWFAGFWRRLRKAGFELVRYRVPCVPLWDRASGHVMFDRVGAEVVDAL